MFSIWRVAERPSHSSISSPGGRGQLVDEEQGEVSEHWCKGFAGRVHTDKWQRTTPPQIHDLESLSLSNDFREWAASSTVIGGMV
jgi:hypothetical protein